MCTTDDIVEVFYEHFATCLGTAGAVPPLRDETEASYAVSDCKEHWSGSQYPKWNDLKRAYQAHIRATGHRVHVGQFCQLTLKEPT